MISVETWLGHSSIYRHTLPAKIIAIYKLQAVWHIDYNSARDPPKQIKRAITGMWR